MEQDAGDRTMKYTCGDCLFLVKDEGEPYYCAVRDLYTFCAEARIGGKAMSEDRWVYNPVERPLPVVRDECGEIKRQTVKQLFQKINEELDELKEAFVCYDHMDDDEELLNVAEEAADTITAITTLCEALGIDADARNEAQRRVNEKNRKRGRL